MGRIKQGLDYFPLNTDFMHDRIVRRIMKREGDSAFTVILYTLSYLYSGEGYYVRADKEFCDELSDQLFSTDNERVHRILCLLVDYGFFDAALYERYGILTSMNIQRQYLFITKRRSRRHLFPDYCLLPEDAAVETPDNVYETDDSVAESRNTATISAHIKRKEKERKENILPNPPCQGGDEERDGGEFSEYDEGGRGSAVSNREPEAVGIENEPAMAKGTKKKRELTQEDIDGMRPPTDGLSRNFAGLLDNLRLYHIPPAEQYAIVLKSNYGEIGGKVWQGLGVIRGSGGKIKLPGHYLLSVLK